MLKEAYEEALRLLKEHRATLDKIAEFLITKETITGKEFMKIYRECEGIAEPEETEIATVAEPHPEQALPEEVYDDSVELPKIRGPFTREELTNGNVRIKDSGDRSDGDDSDEYWDRIRRV